jgi:hypothetical protein
MIVRTVAEGTLMISQSDHARLSGIFASHWGNSAFGRPQKTESVIRGAAFHDCGWYSYDTRPLFDADAHTTPNFLKVPFDDGEIAAHKASIDWLWSIDSYAGLLVSRHRTGLFRARYATTQRPPPPPLRDLSPAAQAFLEAEERRQELAFMSVDREQFQTDFHLLQAWDFLSLFLCTAEPTHSVIGPVPTGYASDMVELTLKPSGPDTILISPYPFDIDVLEVSVVARTLAPAAFEDQTAFRRAYFGTPPTTRRFRFVAATS